jgi:hypothetical protein
MVTTRAGETMVVCATNGAATMATFSGPWGVSVDAPSNVFVADFGNQLIRKITQ